MKRRISAFIMTVAMLFACGTSAYAANINAREELIQREIEALEAEVYASVYAQLESQNALSHLDTYMNYFSADIESQVRYKYGETYARSATSSYSCPYGAVLSYTDTSTSCDVAVTYLDYDNSYYFVLNKIRFTCYSIVEQIISDTSSFIAGLGPIAQLLAIQSLGNASSWNLVLNAQGFAKVVNVYDTIEGISSSVIGGWTTHTIVSVPVGVSNVCIVHLPYHNPWH